MKHRWLLMPVLGLLGFAVAQSASAFTNTDLVGAWQSAGCERLDAGPQPAFIQRSFEFTLSTWQLRFVLYADPACTVKLLTSRIAGPYTLGAAVNGLARTRQVTWGQTAKFLTPHNAEIMQVMNGAGCGDARAGLEVEREMTVTGCVRFGMPSVKDYPQEYDLLSLQSGKLYTGLRRENMNLEVNRPVALFEFGLVKR